MTARLLSLAAAVTLVASMMMVVMMLASGLPSAAEEKGKESPVTGEKARETSGKKEPNRLAREKSPYLLQHALNPVDWYPWGAEAFEKARKEEKPIFLSIGYSTCHWCHVMERESFEDKTIAAYLNEHFVAIKVDREERPDVDDVYMASVHAMGRRGGWPLSVFLTPEGKPFFGATYFPPDTFLRLCQSITEAWKTQRGELAAGAQRLTEHLQKEAEALRGESSLKAEALERAFGSFRDTHDARHGGFGSAPKFPRTSVLDFLLRYAVTRGARERGESEAALAMVERTLDGMVRGGIRDHLAGGFHRYSTDEVWLIPHFEKMLYDQALIASTLADSYRLTGNEVHREVAREILDYLLARMTGPEGEIYSAEDADTEGEEGKTYVWRRAEVLEILGKERGERFSRFYDVTEEGNFEEGGPGASVLRIVLPGGLAALAAAEKRPLAEVAAELVADRAKLLAVRDRRPQPLRDDKVLTGWNGLAISAFSQVHQITGEARYLEAARRAAGFVLARLSKDGVLARRYRSGERAGMGFLDDYAYFVHGLLDLHESSFERRWLEEAVRLGRDMVTRFWDSRGGGFHSTSAQHEALIVRSKEFYDGAVPSGNAVAFLNLLRLEAYTGEKTFAERSAEIGKTVAALLDEAPTAYPLALCGAFFRLEGAREIAIVGPPAAEATRAMVEAVHRRFLPAKILLRVESQGVADELSRLVPLLEGKLAIDGKPTAYVCRDRVCKLPARDLETLRKQLEEG